jgi:hypothetical protein
MHSSQVDGDQEFVLPDDDDDDDDDDDEDDDDDDPVVDGAGFGKHMLGGSDKGAVPSSQETSQHTELPHVW